MEKSNFDQLLHRYLTNDVSEEEKNKIEAWLEVMKTEDNADLELSKEVEDKLFHKITSKTTRIEDVIAVVPLKRNTRIDLWLKIAATILLVGFAAYAVIRFINRTTDRDRITSRDGIEKLILNDGTLVWLRGKSELQYYQKKENASDVRVASLQGEGLFEVAKDASRPFIVNCGEVKITVVGTSFNLKAIGDTMELSVLTGKVNVSTDIGNALEVVPNEKVIYEGDGQFKKISITETEEERITRNTGYVMSFSDVAMGNVVKSLEEKFNIDIEVENKSINNCRITVDLTDQSLEKSLQMITDVLHVKYARNGDDITLTGSGCD